MCTTSGIWINRYDPDMATVPDPRPNNRVRGNWFEGLVGLAVGESSVILLTAPLHPY